MCPALAGFSWIECVDSIRRSNPFAPLSFLPIQHHRSLRLPGPGRGQVCPHGLQWRLHHDHVDRIVKLCLDIFPVRECGEMKLEEDLTAKLIFLYRSPAILMEYTRYKRD